MALVIVARGDGAMITVQDFVNHAINGHKYMQGINRTKERVKSTGEVFTPDELVKTILEKIRDIDHTAFKKPKTFLDPSCGDGQFLVWVAAMKLTKGDLKKLSNPNFLKKGIHTEYPKILSTIYGVDLMPDNVEKAINRLCLDDSHLSILTKNIRCENALTYDFSFD